MTDYNKLLNIKPEPSDYTPFYIAIGICSFLLAFLFIFNCCMCFCVKEYKAYWQDHHTGNRWILPLFVSTPKDQPPVDL